VPKKLDEDILEMNDISEIQDEADAGQSAEQSADAASSTAEDVSKPVEADTLSIVRDVVGAKDEAAASSATEAAKDGQTTVDPATTKEPDNAEYSDVPFNKHPRFQEVLTKLKTAETDAVRYRNVENFIAEQGLGAEEAADLLRIGGLMKTNPAEAWRLMRPTVEKVLKAAGEILPDDLKQRVQAGQLDQETAAEISRNRATLQSVEARQQFERERVDARDQENRSSQIQGAVSSWEADRKLKDPNFAAKMPALSREVVWLQSQEGKPTDPLAVQQQLQRAYDTVSASFVPVPTPRPKPAIRPVTGGQVASAVRPEPTNTLDIIRNVVAARTA